MTDVLITRGLTRQYSKRSMVVTALQGVDLVVKQGDFIAIQGPSGSGKTTLLNILGTLDRPTEGDVIIDGRETSGMGERELERSGIRGRSIGFIFQEFNLIPILSAIENVELPMEHTELAPAEKRERARKLLELVGLGDRMEHRPHELSAGQQQRVAIARALANDPPILLADEPTGNLDSKTGRHIVELLGELNRTLGKTVIMVTHDNEMAKLAKRILLIEDGRISRVIDTAASAAPTSADAMKATGTAASRYQSNAPGRYFWNRPCTT
jgi:putative ABC transport system ATP-binding protein